MYVPISSSEVYWLLLAFVDNDNWVKSWSKNQFVMSVSENRTKYNMNDQTRTQGYKTFSILNSHEIYLVIYF